jgi:hypothetical protein
MHYFIKSLLPIATLANLVGKVGSEESAQLSVWKLEVASCNFTISVGEVGSFEGRLGREWKKYPSYQFENWELPVATSPPQLAKLAVLRA